MDRVSEDSRNLAGLRDCGTKSNNVVFFHHMAIFEKKSWFIYARNERN